MVQKCCEFFHFHVASWLRTDWRAAAVCPEYIRMRKNFLLPALRHAGRPLHRIPTGSTKSNTMASALSFLAVATAFACSTLKNGDAGLVT
jgi:hypothetical protein